MTGHPIAKAFRNPREKFLENSGEVSEKRSTDLEVDISSQAALGACRISLAHDGVEDRISLVRDGIRGLTEETLMRDVAHYHIVHLHCH